MKQITLTVDSRKRVSLNKLLPDLPVSSVRAYRDGANIVLEPMVEIPARELWLYENSEALAKVKTGLSQKGTIERGSFSRYAEG